jgi:hypothetical protein
MNFGGYLRRGDGRSLCRPSAGSCWSFGRNISIEWLESPPLLPIGRSVSTTFSIILKDFTL